MFCFVGFMCLTLCFVLLDLRVSHCFVLLDSRVSLYVLCCLISVFHIVFSAIGFTGFTLCFVLLDLLILLCVLCCWFSCFTLCCVLLDSRVSLCVVGFTCFTLYCVLLDSRVSLCVLFCWIHVFHFVFCAVGFTCFALCFVLLDIPVSNVTFLPSWRRRGPTITWPDRQPYALQWHCYCSQRCGSGQVKWRSDTSTKLDIPTGYTRRSVPTWAAFSPESLSIGPAQRIVAVKGELFTESARYVFVFDDLPGRLHRSRRTYRIRAAECCSYSLTSSQCCREDHRNACTVTCEPSRTSETLCMPSASLFVSNNLW